LSHFLLSQQSRKRNIFLFFKVNSGWDVLGNREMVDRADFVVFCIQYASGGAWQTMKYAKKQGISCVNLNDPLEDLE